MSRKTVMLLERNDPCIFIKTKVSSCTYQSSNFFRDCSQDFCQWSSGFSLGILSPGPGISLVSLRDFVSRSFIDFFSRISTGVFLKIPPEFSSRIIQDSSRNCFRDSYRNHFAITPGNPFRIP